MAWLQREDTCKLYYEIHGDGKETLLLLHGNGEDVSCFTHQIPFFKQYYRVIVMDMRGHGKSSLGHRELDFFLFAQDVKALLDELKITSVHMLGFSDGGNTAMTFALQYPTYLTSLILNGANRNTKGIKAHVQIPIIIGYKMLCLFPFAQTRQKRQVMGLMVHYPHISLEAIKQIQVPTLVLVGSNDMVKSAHSKELADTIPNAELQILQGSHFLVNEAYQEYNECVLTFLKKHAHVL